MNPDQTAPKDTLANSEEPDEMLQMQHFIRVYKTNIISETEIEHF